MLGCLALGIGDSFAAIVGINYGKTKIFCGNKSLEGTLAFTASIVGTVIFWCLLLGSYGPTTLDMQFYINFIIITFIISVIEASSK